MCLLIWHLANERSLIECSEESIQLITFNSRISNYKKKSEIIRCECPAPRTPETIWSQCIRSKERNRSFIEEFSSKCPKVGRLITHTCQESDDINDLYSSFFLPRSFLEKVLRIKSEAKQLAFIANFLHFCFGPTYLSIITTYYFHLNSHFLLIRSGNSFLRNSLFYLTERPPLRLP